MNSIKKLILIVGVCACLLSGCVRYQAAPLTVQDAALALQSHSLDEQALAKAGEHLQDVRLLQFVNPNLELSDGLALDEAFLVALAFNPRLQELRLQLQEQEALIVHAAALPTLLWEGQTVTEAGRWQGESNGKTDLLSLMNLFKRPAREQQAQATTHIAACRVLQLEADLYCGLYDSYLQAQGLQSYIDTLEHIIQDYRATYIRRCETVVQVGRLSSDSLQEIRSPLLQLETRLQDIRNRKEATLETIRRLCGLSATTNLQLQALPSTSNLQELVSREESLGDLALQRSPELQLQLARYQVTESRLRLAVLDQYPDIKFGPAINWTSLTALAGGAWKLELPVFYQNQGEIRAAQLSRDAAAKGLQAEVLRVQFAIRSAIRNISYSNSQIEKLETTDIPVLQQQRDAELARLDFDPKRIEDAAQAYVAYGNRQLDVREFDLKLRKHSGRLARELVLPLHSKELKEVNNDE